MCLIGASLFLVSCGGDSGGSSTATEPADSVVLASTTTAPTLQLSRETLLALQKCTSDSRGAHIWADEPALYRRLVEIADLCSEASDQLAVDQQLNPDFDYDIQVFIVEIGLWTLKLREAVVTMTSGTPADAVALENGAKTFDSRAEAFLDKVSP
jgi:hypothetical protein